MTTFLFTKSVEVSIEDYIIRSNRNKEYMKKAIEDALSKAPKESFKTLWKDEIRTGFYHNGVYYWISLNAGVCGSSYAIENFIRGLFQFHFDRYPRYFIKLRMGKKDDGYLIPEWELKSRKTTNRLIDWFFKPIDVKIEKLEVEKVKQI